MKIFWAIFILAISTCFADGSGEIKLKLKCRVKNEKGFITISGKTNLPERTQLWITLKSISGKHIATTKTKVVSGKFRSQRFSDGGKPLRGSVIAYVTCHFNEFWQTPQVLEKLSRYKSKLFKKNKVKGKDRIVLEVTIGTCLDFSRSFPLPRACQQQHS